LLGYARAGTGQELDRQVAAAVAFGVDGQNVYADLSPQRKDRPRREELLRRVGPVT
jgi:hypothetical protein